MCFVFKTKLVGQSEKVERKIISEKWRKNCVQPFQNISIAVKISCSNMSEKMKSDIVFRRKMDIHIPLF